jgi:hypothetical protein
MKISIPIKSRDCCLKEKKRLVKTLRTCDLWSPGSEERHNCYRNAARESGQHSRQCILE